MNSARCYIEGVRSMIIIFIFLWSSVGVAQQNVFQLFRDDVAKGDEYFNEGSYSHALNMYLQVGRKADVDTELRIARCYYHLHEYQKCVSRFQHALGSAGVALPSDRFLFAEALAAVGQYDKALKQYQEYLVSFPEDEIILNKIWRLKNVHYLYEDSLHFSVTRMAINGPFSEIGAVPYQDGIVFVSNRKGNNTFEESDALTGENHYRFYYAAALTDPHSKLFNGYGKVMPFRHFESRLHNGPLSFYQNGTRAVFTRTSDVASKNGKRTLQLAFAVRNGKTWKEEAPFLFNSSEYSVTEPYITEDGHVLIFSSDMKGGYGGRDLYKCEFKNGKWSSPTNLGSRINTRLDETFPHIFKNQLYFSSNGHPGMGGADVFRVPMAGDNEFGEVTNPGYPLNSSADDFGFYFKPDGNVALLSSNRMSSDDLYEVEIDLQSYPVQISGILKAKEFSLTDSSILRILPMAKMYLVDHTREVVIDEVLTDNHGHFELKIPYFSQYKIKVVEKGGVESIVSLQIPRQKKTDYTHEIVVVKDAFHTPQE